MLLSGEQTMCPLILCGGCVCVCAHREKNLNSTIFTAVISQPNFKLYIFLYFLNSQEWACIIYFRKKIYIRKNSLRTSDIWLSSSFSFNPLVKINSDRSHQIRATSFPTVKFICISAHILPFLLFQRRNWPYSYLKLVLTLQLITLSTLKRLCFCGYPIFHLHYLFFLLLIISSLETYKINPPLLTPFPPKPPSHFSVPCHCKTQVTCVCFFTYKPTLPLTCFNQTFTNCTRRKQHHWGFLKDSRFAKSIIFYISAHVAQIIICFWNIFFGFKYTINQKNFSCISFLDSQWVKPPSWP